MRHAAALAMWAVVVSLAGAAGCAGDDDDSGGATGGTTSGGGTAGAFEAGAAGAGGATACAPNSVQSCDCAAGGTGTARCLADGTAWGACECVTYGIELGVSPAGSDSASGTLADPFATLERARDEIRALEALPSGGVVVWLQGGTHLRSTTFELGSEDSGASDRPVVYRGAAGTAARLVGGLALEASAFTRVTDSSPVWTRLDPVARDHLVQIDLGAQGITDFGVLARRGFCQWGGHAALELFVDGRPMTLARWPDADDNDVVPLETADRVEVFGTLDPDVTGAFLRDGEQDGVSSFSRDGLVGGRQYRLYRHTWEYEGNLNTAWFLTTNASGYPSDTDPWWYLYADELGPMSTSNGASGQPTFTAPTAVNHGFTSVLEAQSDTVFTYAGDRPERWAEASEVWLHGYWQYAWADCHQPAAAIDTAARTISFSEVPGYGIVAGQPYYAYNLLEEITVPGEWHLDRTTGILYLYPPGELVGSEILVSLLDAPLVRLQDTAYVELRDVTLEAGRAELVRVEGGHDNRLVGVTLRNAGGDGAVISGERNAIRDCLVHDTGSRGVALSGGDRPSLTAAGNSVENCHIHRFGRWEWTYRPGVDLSGVGQRVAHNSIHDAPHSAILFGGNDHRIELNHIHHVCQFSSDAGAIYAGRDWGARGNVIRHNFVHHIDTWFQGYGVHGVYLDDCLSGIEVSGNVLYAISGHGILHGGGRDDVLVDNLLVGCGTGLSADARGYEWRPDAGPNDIPGDSWNLLEKLQNVGYQDEPWASRYPECAAIPNDWNAIIAPDATWLYPEGSVFSRNLGWQNGVFTRGSAAFSHYAEMADNVEDADPQFVDEASLDLSLQPASPALQIPGFEPIPFDEIGIRP